LAKAAFRAFCSSVACLSAKRCAPCPPSKMGRPSEPRRLPRELPRRIDIAPDRAPRAAHLVMMRDRGGVLIYHRSAAPGAAQPFRSITSSTDRNDSRGLTQPPHPSVTQPLRPHPHITRCQTDERDVPEPILTQRISPAKTQGRSRETKAEPLLSTATRSTTDRRPPTWARPRPSPGP
jgi:hypothetical protein